MKRVELALICLLLWAGSSYAGEALITKVRGSNLTIDTGSESGLVQGMTVTIIRPPGEALIHPIAGENLGAPEVEIGFGEVSKTANRAHAQHAGAEDAEFAFEWYRCWRLCGHRVSPIAGW